MSAKNRYILTLGLALMLAAAGCQGQTAKQEQATGSQTAAAAPEVSGTIEGGLRLVTLDPAAPSPVVRVYRGDYVQMALSDGAPFTVDIDSLKIAWTWPVPEGGKPYFKMETPGRFPFRAGAVEGTFEVLEFKAAAYREVSAAEAASLIANVKPFVLDVRTPGEFADGHLQGATLIPVQEFQRRIGELASHRQEPVFVYCHSGNRSTVAAKMLIDAGFEQVINLRKGINDWKAAGLPLVR